MPKKKILLLGAGHANIQVLYHLATVDRSLFELTLISDVSFSPYSGMIPSFLAGVYQLPQLQFDLRKICHRFEFNFIEAQATQIRATENKVLASNGELYDYDICSANIGIQPLQIPTTEKEQDGIIYLKPISQLIAKWNAVLSTSSQFVDFTIIGGGAAAFEIAVACRLRFSDLGHKIKIITGRDAFLQGENKYAQYYGRKSLRKLKIDLIEGQRVEKIIDDSLVLSNGQILSRQICLVGTSAEAPPIFKNSCLPINANGFVQVSEDLLVLGSANLFAAGDCCEFTARPLPKAGVYAVREGPVLAKNIISILNNRPLLTSYTPQKSFLKILMSGENQAILTYRKFAFQGWIAWKLKDYIDKNFMKRFQ